VSVYLHLRHRHFQWLPHRAVHSFHSSLSSALRQMSFHAMFIGSTSLQTVQVHQYLQITMTQSRTHITVAISATTTIRLSQRQILMTQRKMVSKYRWRHRRRWGSDPRHSSSSRDWQAWRRRPEVAVWCHRSDRLHATSIITAVLSHAVVPVKRRRHCHNCSLQFNRKLRNLTSHLCGYRVCNVYDTIRRHAILTCARKPA